MKKKILSSLKKHKIITGIAVILLLGGVYFTYRVITHKGDTIRYVTAAAEEGTLVVSVSGTGQVSASNQIDIKPKNSGVVTAIQVSQGQEVKSGTLLIQLDTTDAQKAVRDAQSNLESAKLALTKLQEPADALSILQAENALAQTKESKQQGSDNLKKAYDDGFNSVANTFLDLPTIMTGLDTILNGNTIREYQTNINFFTDSVKGSDERILQYRDDAAAKYQEAKNDYDQNFTDYKAVSRSSSIPAIEAIISETYNTTKIIAEAVKDANNLIQEYRDKSTDLNMKIEPLADTYLANLNSYTGQTNTHLSDLLGIQQTTQNNKNAIIDADRSIAEKTESLNKLKNGPDPLDVQTQQLAVTQRQNALVDAQENLANYYIRAPFEGIVAQINVKLGDSISSSSSAITFISKQKIAEISLNEVDVTKVKIGQQVTLTFDAIPNLSIAGKVVEIDTIGTISQGVVTYNVKIEFDTQDIRVKPGMSVSAAIITDVKQNVLLIPNTAVKQQNQQNYVEILVNKVPQQQPIQTGLANDTFTEITNGLAVGDAVITQTISAKTTQSQSQQNSGFRFPGLTGGGGTRSGGFGR